METAPDHFIILKLNKLEKQTIRQQQKSMTSAPSCAAWPCSLRIDTHKKIESATVSTYEGVENYVVDAYKAIETAFVDRFLEKLEDENNEQ